MKNPVAWTLLLATGLAGCGGSSGDESAGGSELAGERIQIETIRYDYCGVESPLAGAEVLVHHQDGRILMSRETGSDGTVSFEWPQNGAHFTVIGQDTDKNGYSGVDVRTFANWNSGEPGPFYFADLADRSSCQCQDVTFDLGDLPVTYWDADINLLHRQGASRYITQLNLNKTIEMCQYEGEWQPVDLVLDASIRSGEVYAARFEVDFDSTRTVRLDSNTFADSRSRGELVNVTVNDAEATTYSYARTPEGETASYFFSNYNGELYHFPNLHDHNLAIARTNDFSGSTVEGEAGYWRLRRAEIKDGAVRLDLPQNEAAFKNAAVNLFEGMVADRPSSYNFSNLGPAYNLLRLSMYAYGEPASWSVEAPLQGTMPALELPDYAMRELEQLGGLRLDVMIYGYHNGLSADEFRRVRLDGNQPYSFWDNYEYQSLEVFIY
ncbi:hypothetical protein KUV89_13285 [Marinobacter hydrocarbonoclasticus]|nr:hypothetical protein [Marinobacter nauticus]